MGGKVSARWTAWRRIGRHRFEPKSGFGERRSAVKPL